MSATRSRTENWRKSLSAIQARGGTIEITLPHRYDAHHSPAVGGNLLWRVRVLEVSFDRVVVESPSALGRSISINDGADLVAIMTVGQNRWMFRTRNRGSCVCALHGGRATATALALEAPEVVERCQRRAFYRISTVGLLMPKVECRGLLDPSTARVAELATAERVRLHEESAVVGRIGPSHSDACVPDVGPGFFGALTNIGGGGVGVVFEEGDAVHFSSGSTKRLWLTMDLAPYIPAPIGVVSRVVHTRLDSQKRLYAGMSFEFDHNPHHKDFMIDWLCRFVNRVQRDQLKRTDSD